DGFRTTITDVTWASATTLSFVYHIEELPIKPNEIRGVYGVQGGAANCHFFDDAGTELNTASYQFGWGYEFREGKTNVCRKIVTVEVPQGATTIVVQAGTRDLNTQPVRLPERRRP